MKLSRCDFQNLAPAAGRLSDNPAEKKHRVTPKGYLHCGPSRRGPLCEMVHNGIEYGLMAAYAEGLYLKACQRRKIPPRSDANQRRCASGNTSTISIWGHHRKCGAAVRSWLRLLEPDGHFPAPSAHAERFSGRVSDSGEAAGRFLGDRIDGPRRF